MFTCEAEPKAWSLNADDVAIAVNETLRTSAGRSCRQQLHTACLTLSVIDQINGTCS